METFRRLSVSEVFSLVSGLRGPRLRALVDAARDVAVNSPDPALHQVAQEVMRVTRLIRPDLTA